MSDESKEKYEFGKKLVDPIFNSLNQLHHNCMVDSKENYKFDQD